MTAARALGTAALLAVMALAGCVPSAPGASAAPSTVPSVGPAASAATATATPPAPAATATPSAAPLPSPAPESPCWTAADGTRIRAEAGTDARILCVMPEGIELVRTEFGQEWSKVRFGDIEGYVRNDLLSGIPAEARTPDLAGYLADARIIVRKSSRRLELWDGDALIGCYRIGLGWSPEGPKKAEGDGRTPEGEYYVCLRNGNSRFYLSLGLSYPNKDDAKAALDEGRIGQSTYDRIAEAIDGRQRPPWDTPLGGEIMIHGMGGDRDWTAGCVAVDNEVMDILWSACPAETPVTILP